MIIISDDGRSVCNVFDFKMIRSNYDNSVYRIVNLIDNNVYGTYSERECEYNLNRLVRAYESSPDSKFIFSRPLMNRNKKPSIEVDTEEVHTDMNVIAHQIIEYIESRPEYVNDENDIIKGLEETFPKCNFKFHVFGSKRRLCAIQNFCILWFDIRDDNCRDVRFLTFDHFR